MSNLLRECYPAESNHSDDPAEDGHSGVFDWIATCPSMVAHMFDTDFELICDPAMFKAKGKKKGHFRNTYYENHVKNRALSYLEILLGGGSAREPANATVTDDAQ